MGTSTKLGSTVIPRVAALVEVSPVTDSVKILAPNDNTNNKTSIVRLTFWSMDRFHSYRSSRRAVAAVRRSQRWFSAKTTATIRLQLRLIPSSPPRKRQSLIPPGSRKKAASRAVLSYHHHHQYNSSENNETSRKQHSSKQASKQTTRQSVVVHTRLRVVGVCKSSL
jgi:hypothetical protein